VHNNADIEGLIHSFFKVLKLVWRFSVFAH